MSSRIVHCYDYVNHPYPRVRDILLANPSYVFRHATAAAATHAATLHVRIGSIDVGADVAIQVSVAPQAKTELSRPTTELTLGWAAVKNPKLFPTMVATLSIYPLTPTETQLEIEGEYLPPMGTLGEVIDAAVGHRLAEASVTRFVQEVAGWLREELALTGAQARP
jgi:hypothetical protein